MLVFLQLLTELEGLLGNHNNLLEAIVGLLASSEVLYEAVGAASVIVFQVSQVLLL